MEGALARALEVFWRRGYEGASLTELTEAMGITRPSLYATYGNKEELFRKALDLYDARHLGFARAALAAPNAREVAARLLAGFADLATGIDNPPGCLGTVGALACSTAADPIKAELTRRRGLFEGELVQRLMQARAEGDLAEAEVPTDLARYVMVVAGGLAVQGAGGATRASLARAVEMALRAWPAPEHAVGNANVATAS